MDARDRDSPIRADPGSTPRIPAGRVLVVDDSETNLDLLTRLLARDGYVVERACDGAKALELVDHNPPDLVLLDVVMPHLNGFETCRELKRQAATRLIPVVLVTALQGASDRIRGIEAGADDFLSKPFSAQELQARVRSLVRLKRYTDDLESAETLIDSLALTIEARDPYTEGHCQRLAAYAEACGRALGLSDDDIAALRRGGFLHDIGKIAVSDVVLLKPGPLTPAEHDLIKQHPIVGDQLCGRLRSLKHVRPIVRHHHERFDGSGYPDGLRGDDIPLLAQVMSIVDIFDALTTARPYKGPVSAECACQMLVDEARQGWRRADLVEVFTDLVLRQQLPVIESGAARVGSLHSPVSSR